MNQNLHMIVLGTRDMKKATEFYENGLGWTRSSASQGDIVFFKLGGIVLALYPWDGLALDAAVPATGKGFAGVAFAYNTRSEQEVAEIMDQVKSLGATIVKPAQKVFWGGFSGYFKDLDGHLFEVAYNPFVKFDKQGNLTI